MNRPLRRRLPDRRIGPIAVARFERPGRADFEIVYQAGYSRLPDVAPAEVFINEILVGGGALKPESDTVAALTDGCVLASILMQCGYGPAELAAHLGREGTSGDAVLDADLPAATPLGAVLRDLARRAPDDAAAVAEVYRAIRDSEVRGQGSEEGR